MTSSLPFLCLFYLLMGFGTLLSLTSLHWMFIWAGLEINLVGFLPLMVYIKSSANSEAAVKYFVIQSLGSSFLMLGSVCSYNMTYSWEMFILESNLVCLIFILIGLLIKMGMFPFHYWIPGVMAGLPWLPCLLLTTWQKLGPLFLLSFLLNSNVFNTLVIPFFFVASFSSILGGLGGLNQTQVRALLAYSSINHMGWFVYSGVQGNWVLKVYFGSYVVIIICLFAALWRSNFNLMKDLNYMYDNSFMQMVPLIVWLSLGGLPPLLGFIPKMVVIMSAVPSNSALIYLPLLILGSLMSLYYYLHLFYAQVLTQWSKNKTMFFTINNTNPLLLALVVFNLVGGFMGVMINSAGSL